MQSFWFVFLLNSVIGFSSEKKKTPLGSPDDEVWVQVPR